MTLISETPPASVGGKSRGSRRLSRELVLRALYQWQLNDSSLAALVAQAEAADIYGRANVAHFEVLLAGVLKHADELDEALAPMLDREVAALSPIEHGVLLLGGYELIHQPDVPYRVVINEAVDLAKRYGGTDGHKYINGVLDKLAQLVRQSEVGATRRSAG